MLLACHHRKLDFVTSVEAPTAAGMLSGFDVVEREPGKLDASAEQRTSREREMEMKALNALAALALAGLLAGPMAACSGTSTSRSTGEYVDDSTISNKIRAKLIGDADLNVFQIDVTTNNGVVQLSGFVNSAAAKARASSVVGTVEGVKSVQNNLIVK